MKHTCDLTTGEVIVGLVETSSLPRLTCVYKFRILMLASAFNNQGQHYAYFIYIVSQDASGTSSLRGWTLQNLWRFPSSALEQSSTIIWDRTNRRSCTKVMVSPWARTIANYNLLLIKQKLHTVWTAKLEQIFSLLLWLENILRQRESWPNNILISTLSLQRCNCFLDGVPLLSVGWPHNAQEGTSLHSIQWRLRTIFSIVESEVSEYTASRTFTRNQLDLCINSLDSSEFTMPDYETHLHILEFYTGVLKTSSPKNMNFGELIQTNGIRMVPHTSCQGTNEQGTGILDALNSDIHT